MARDTVRQSCPIGRRFHTHSTRNSALPRKQGASSAQRVKKLFRYENSTTVKRRKFQLLWSNIEILKPAVYAKRPSPAVSNRWKDGDAVARIACELLERNLDFQFDVMDYDLAFKQLRDDFLLYARGVVRLRATWTARRW